MTIKKIEQLDDESKRAKFKTSSGLKVKTHIKAGPGTVPTGGVNDVRHE